MNIILIFSIVFLSAVILFFIFNTRATKTSHINKMHTMHTMHTSSNNKTTPEPHCHPWGCGKISSIVPKEVDETLSKIKTKSSPSSKINRKFLYRFLTFLSIWNSRKSLSLSALSSPIYLLPSYKITHK